VATTDGPLILFWTLQLWLMWRALAQPDHLSRWLLVGLVLALGMLSKYTMSAVLASWVLWWLAHRTTAVSKGMALAAGVAALAMLPHLAWNQAHDWPTLKHTADLLSDGHDSIPQGMAAVTLRLGEYVASQCLLAGPVLWVMAVLGLSRWVRHKKTTSSPQASPAVWAWHASWPLWVIGGIQAMQGTAQINWPAPALLGACLALAWLLAAGQTQWRWRAPVLVVVTASLLATAVSLGGDWRARLGLPVQKSKWDLWGRARGWQEALHPLETLVAQHPEAVLVALDRTLIVHSAYAWREQRTMALSWQQTPHPLHHYDLLYRFDPAKQPQPVLLLVMGELPTFVRAKYQHVQLLSEAQPAGRALFLWLLKDPLP
jgi:4-amino-4-deoxy-L-arabinose transferase-like glycosyltransferase